jgi:transketolase
MLEKPNDIGGLKREIVRTSARSREGHIPSAFSILDILWVLYQRVLHVDPANPRHDGRDRFILSKGHGSLALYAILADKGFFPIAELERFATFDSMLGGHPDCNKVPGVEASTGSLGHGFPFALGIALGLSIQKKRNRVFVLIGDGECNEGTIWETAQLAAHHQLDNLTCVIDYNHSNDRALKLGDLAAKFASFGWASTVINGHDHEAIYGALTRNEMARPRVVVAETIKGYGSKLMENNPAWHHKSPNEHELRTILEELT